MKSNLVITFVSSEALVWSSEALARSSEALVRSFPVNFAKFLRAPFFTEHLWWLFLFFFIPYKCELQTTNKLQTTAGMTIKGECMKIISHHEQIFRTIIVAYIKFSTMSLSILFRITGCCIKAVIKHVDHWPDHWHATNSNLTKFQVGYLTLAYTVLPQ